MVRVGSIAAGDDPWEDVGVEWTKPGMDDRALFTYGQFDYPVPADARVTDVTAGRVIEIEGAPTTECCHTYRIEATEGR
jgi:hypothetical protein